MRRDGLGMRALACVGWLTLLPALVVAGMRFAPTQSWVPAAQAVGFFPLTAPTAIAAFCMFAISRRWGSAALAALLVLASALTLVPRVTDNTAPSGPQPTESTHIRVGAINAFFGQVDPVALTRQVTDLELDVFCVSEAPPSLADAMRTAGLTPYLPESVSLPAPGTTATLMFSRLPLEPLPMASEFGARLPRARVSTATGPVTVSCVHTTSPTLRRVELWSDELSAVRDVVGATDGPQIVMGDFNATWDHRLLRRIATSGNLHRVASATGNGLTPTWPVTNGPLPFPVVAIDHILTDLAVQSSQTIEVPGTDHRMVTGVLRLPHLP